MPFKFNALRRDKFAKAKYRVTNRAEYNEALRQRGDVTVWFSEDAVSRWCAVRSGDCDLLDPARGVRLAASPNAGLCPQSAAAHADGPSCAGFFDALPACAIASDRA